MNPVTLKQLRYLDAIARHLHFGRAADACCVTQPALSMQILELERALGVLLVERARSGVRLTAEGEAVARRASRILTEADDLAAYCALSHGLLSGRLRLGLIPTIAPYLLPAFLALARTDYPHLDLHVRETQTRSLLSELEDGKLDVAVLALPAEGSDLVTVPLFSDRFLLAVPPSYPIPRNVRATREMIVQERLLLLEEGHCLRDQAIAYCDLRPVAGINTLGISTLSTVAGMVEAGQGITLLPEICLKVETAGREITIVPFADPEPIRTIGLVWRATSPRLADFTELGRLLKRCHPGSPAAREGEPRTKLGAEAGVKPALRPVRRKAKSG